jgi:flagellin
MRINHNIAALRANNLLSKTNKHLNTSLEKLSSGLRINKAADDAAGMAISEKMRTQIAALNQASRNASDGISVIQTAEGALAEVESMLQRMRELSVQASNGTNTNQDTQAIQTEINELSKEIQRLSDTMEFNTMKLLDGNIDRISYSDNNKVRVVSKSDTVDIGNYRLKVTQDARQAVVVGNTTDFDAASSSTVLVSDYKITEDQAGTVIVNGIKVTVDAGDTMEDVFSKMVSACDKSDINLFAVSNISNTGGSLEQAGYTSVSLDDVTIGAGVSFVFVSEDYGFDENITINCKNDKLCKVLGLTTQGAGARGVDAKVELTKKTAMDKKTSLFQNTSTVSVDGDKITISDRNNFKMLVEVEAGIAGTTFTDAAITGVNASVINPVVTPNTGVIDPVNISVLDAGTMKLQIGANAGQTMSVRIPELSPKTLGIDRVNVVTQDGAEEAQDLIDAAINTVSSIRSKLGAYQNRLEHSISNVNTTSENMTESLSRISDVDMAEEMANYTQKSVLAQAGTAMLSQANQRPQTILSLIQK